MFQCTFGHVTLEHDTSACIDAGSGGLPGPRLHISHQRHHQLVMLFVLVISKHCQCDLTPVLDKGVDILQRFSMMGTNMLMPSPNL